MFIKYLKGTNTCHSGHMGQNCQTELITDIYSKSSIRAIGKFIKHQYIPIKVMKNDICL